MHDRAAGALCALSVCFQLISRSLGREARQAWCASFEVQPQQGLHAAPVWRLDGEGFTVMHVWVMNPVCCVVVVSAQCLWQPQSWLLIAGTLLSCVCRLYRTKWCLQQTVRVVLWGL